MGLLDEPLPELIKIPLPEGELRIGELNEEFGEKSVQALKEAGFLGSQNFGYPNRVATIAQPFFIGSYELTYEQYDYYVWSSHGTDSAPDYPSGAPGDNKRGGRPVTNVSWNEANAYLGWLSRRTGEQYRLPTEAEWEYAARAGTRSAYWWGDVAGQGHANCDGCGSAWDNARVAPVGSFAPNPRDLFDTAGNVWEWTCSEWETQLGDSAFACIAPEQRAGSWFNDTDGVRSSARGRFYTDYRSGVLGFRVFRAARTK